MKTYEELYNEIMASDELKEAFTEASKGGEEKILAFLTEHGCEPDSKKLVDFLKDKTSKSGELNDDELEAAAGGRSKGTNVFINVMSSVTVIGCGVNLAISMTTDSVGENYQVCGTQ